MSGLADPTDDELEKAVWVLQRCMNGREREALEAISVPLGQEFLYERLKMLVSPMCRHGRWDAHKAPGGGHCAGGVLP